MAEPQLSMTQSLARRLSKPELYDAPDEPKRIHKMNIALRILGKWRASLIRNTWIKMHGLIVYSGPFKGLDFIKNSTEGCHVPKLIGTYEQPLHQYIETLIKSKYDIILNIGCAEGYYAVGMAMRCEHAHVYAYDLDANARKTCAYIATKNNVINRVFVETLFTHDDFEKYTEGKALVLCDIEGAEKHLLDPAEAPALCGMTILVETHEGMVPGVTSMLIKRFQDSHEITRINDNGMRSMTSTPNWFYNLNNLDQQIAVWEWRSSATPWLLMVPKNIILH